MHNINEISNIKKSIYDNFVLECITTGSIKIIWNLNLNKKRKKCLR